MIVYVAGPMAGHDDLNRPAFERAADAVRALGHEPVIPHDIPAHEHGDRPCPTTYRAAQVGHDSACYLRGDVKFIVEKADVVLMLDGWTDSRGASFEYELAKATGIPTVFASAIPGALPDEP